MDIVTQSFRARFNREPWHVVRAPGRVNLIGEHTDYNEGFVLPVAIDREVRIALSPRQDRTVVLYSANYDSRTEFDLDRIERDGVNPWSNYPRGVALFLARQNHVLTGLDGAIVSSVPVAAGLSSSAALELASAWAFLVASSKDSASPGLPVRSNLPEPLDLIRLCRKVENEFVGVQCGIMDQFISASGRQHHALFLDCRSLSYEHVPLPDSVKIVVCNTGIRRELGASEYNRRRGECSQGVEFFSRHIEHVSALRDVSSEDLERLARQMDPLIRKRCRHVISENERVMQSVQRLRSGDLEQFGQLMNASHQSLKVDYEVSCQELDLMVEIAVQQPAVLGSRMTGAGFGGCTVSLVKNDYVGSFVNQVKEKYHKETGLAAEIYVCDTSHGAGVVQ
jgi:galactokinase